MIESPCIRNCCLSEEDICLGCFRSLDEIIAWSTVSDQERKLILARSKVRKDAYQARYPKRWLPE